MAALLRSVFLLALIVWLGEVVFLSFVAAPAMFRTFSKPDAGRAVGALFPIYYAVGAVCGAAMLASGAALMRAAVARVAWGANLSLVAFMLALTLYAGAVVQPRAAALRPQLHAAEVAPGVKEEFDRLHRLAVVLNGIVLFCGLASTAITASTLRP